MSKRKWIGAALSLALCSAALSGCNFSNNSPGETAAPAVPEIDGAWTSKTEEQLRQAIAEAPAHGLKPDLFLKGGEKGAALTQAALKYASALANGYSDPKKLFEVYTIPHRTTDVKPGLQQAIQKGDVKAWIESLAPQTDEYRAISQAHVRFLQLAGKDQFKPVADGKPIKPGSRDPRMTQVIGALEAVGYVPPTATAGGSTQTPTSATYSPQLVTAVKALQGEFGFKQDGIIGGDTLDALNAGPAYRARQTAIAMERLRWLPRDAPDTRIDVNTASTTLDYYRDGQRVDRRNVVAGEADKPTPQLQAPLFRLVAKPTWTVPKGIGDKEVADKDPQWIADNGFALKDNLWVQASGPKNSLGFVKFDMQDKEAIYLHDTPAKALFGIPQRHRSHGCVRVEDALEFATVIADQEGVLDKFQEAMEGDEDNKFVNLPNEIPVRLLYQTVFWDGSRVQFRPDIYGWDVNIAKALGLATGAPIRIEQPESSDDVGP